MGPLAAGLLVAAAGAGWAIAADAVTFAISGACLAALHLERAAEREPTAFLRDLRDGLMAVRSRRWVWTFLVYFAVANVMWGAWTALGPVVADRDLGGAWRAYLKRFNHGRGVVLIGHSQGTFVLRRLVREKIDPKPSARRRLVSAVLLGGNVTVRAGGDRGGDFDHVRACRRPRQTGCVVAFSTFNAPVPENALFGRTSDPRLEILCTNPGALGGGSASLTPIFPSTPFAPSVIGAAANLALDGVPRPSTPWAAFPDAYSGRCSKAGGASVFQVKPLRGAFPLTPIPAATWGIHLSDANIALGNLANLVRLQIRAYD